MTKSDQSGNLDKHEFLTKQDLGYKPEALEQAKFEYSPLGKVFNDGLTKRDKGNKKVGILQRLKNIEDNISGNDDDDNDGDGNEKVELFKILKGIKNKGTKISDDDEAIKDIRNFIQN